MKNNTIRKMFLGIEEELYDYLKKTETFKELKEKHKKDEEKLIKTFSKEQEKLFDDVWGNQGDWEAFYLEEGYIRGFKDANKLRDESLR